MSTINHLKTIGLNTSIILFFVFCGVLIHNPVTSQGLKNFAAKYELGFEGSFGVKSFSISSNITEIDGLNVIEEGGNIGFVATVKSFRFKIKQGYYYSSSTVANTVDEVRFAGVINLYPLQWFSKKNSGFQPYLLTGVERNIFKMYGFYGKDSNGNQTSNVNYSVSEAPFLGNISTIQASAGAGLEYSIKKPGHFVQIFTEAKYGKTISTLESNSFFKDTRTSNQLAINIGVAFGYYR